MVNELVPIHQNPAGFPPVTGNVLPFPQAKMPCMHFLASYLTPDKQEDPVQRNIALSLASYNIGAVAVKAYANGVTAFAGKAFMLADGLKHERPLIVGLQECRSKEGGTSQICDYHRIIPDPKGQAAGDVESWFNTVIPLDQDDPAITMKPKDAQIVATGPKFMIVHLGTNGSISMS